VKRFSVSRMHSVGGSRRWVRSWMLAEQKEKRGEARTEGTEGLGLILKCACDACP
jgi:hypothetical protein